jgi:ribose transport system substrate-binding protein
MEKGLKDEAAKDQVNAKWEGPPNAQVAQQMTLMQNYAALRYDAMGVSAIEASSITPVIDDLVKRGMLVITFDSDAPKSKRLIYIGTDNYESGLEAGKQMVALLPQGGNVWGFVGNKSAENARLRIKGFTDAVKGHNINLVDILEDQKDPNLARQNVEQILSAKKDQIQGLLGLYSYNLPAIAEAVKSANLRDKIKIVGFDFEPGTKEAISKGEIDATVVQKPYQFGRLSVEFLYLAKRDGVDKARAEWDGLNPEYPLKDDKINTGVQVITPQNSAPFLAQLKKWGVTSS